MIFVDIDNRRRVRLLLEVHANAPRSRVWAAMSNVEKFAACDPFHTRVCSADKSPIAAGSSIKIVHGFFGVGLTRVGRVLRWEEGVAYTFSDLSARGSTLGFPHIYGYRLRDRAEGGCTLSVSVRGKWTARVLPNWCVAAWLTIVMWLIAALLRREVSRL